MKTILISTFVLTSLFSYSQKGSWYIGGNAGVSASKEEYNSSLYAKKSSWSFSPEIGTFLTNHISLGIGFTTNGNTNERVNVNRQTSIAFGGTIYSRYFIGENTFRPFVGINISTLAGNVKTETFGLNPGSIKSDILSYGANLNIGFSYALSPRISVLGAVGLVGFNSNTTTSPSAGSYSNSGFDANVNTLGNRFTIGFYYTFIQSK